MNLLIFNEIDGGKKYARKTDLWRHFFIDISINTNVKSQNNFTIEEKWSDFRTFLNVNNDKHGYSMN